MTNLSDLGRSDRGNRDLGLRDRGASGGGCCGGDSCGCGHADDAPALSSPAAAGAVSTELAVLGMTCTHCVASVTEELGAIDGVSGVSVDLAVGGASTVTVTSAAPLDQQAVRAAIAEAGYSIQER